MGKWKGLETIRSHGLSVWYVETIRVYVWNAQIVTANSISMW
jgi:hypothetical protein